MGENLETLPKIQQAQQNTSVLKVGAPPEGDRTTLDVDQDPEEYHIASNLVSIMPEFSFLFSSAASLGLQDDQQDRLYIYFRNSAG